MPKTLTLTGANLKLTINNVTIGFVTSFDYSIDYGKQDLRGIDVPFPQEIAPGSQTLRGSIQCLRLRASGALENFGVVANQAPTVPGVVSDQIVEKYISLAISERDTGRVVFRCDKATVTSQRWQLASRGIVTGTFDFEGFLATALA